MKNTFAWKRISALAVALVLALSLAGGALSEQPKPVKLLVGNSGGPKPYAYLDDDNKLIGYEPDIIAALDELLPQYDIEIELTEFNSIFGGIDAGRYAFGTNNITKKPSREEKYLFANQWHVFNYTIAIVTKGRDDIHTLADLGGKKARGGDGGLFSQLFYDSYNADHPDNPILVELSGAPELAAYQDIIDGVLDFTVSEPAIYYAQVEARPELADLLDVIEFSPEESAQIQDPYAWFIYPKTPEGEKLRDEIDAALLQLVDSGKLLELSLKWFGFDITGRNLKAE
jgi:ABC-type amino acid transport substrate-binding protein